MYKRILGANLKLYRKQSGLLQEEVANILNISRTTYVHYETGRTLPALDTLLKLSQLFKINLFSLIEPLFLKNVHYDGNEIVCDICKSYPFFSCYEKLTDNEKSYILSLMQMYINMHP